MKIRNIILWAIAFLAIITLFKFCASKSKTPPISASPSYEIDSSSSTVQPNENQLNTIDTVVPIEIRGDSSQQLM